MYPSAVRQVPELAASLSDVAVPRSAMIAERLVTLPTHELVSEEDVKGSVPSSRTFAGSSVKRAQGPVRSQYCGTETPRPN